MRIQVAPIKAFTDNYIWAIHNHQHCYVVDPGVAEPVNQFIADQKLTLAGILITHHHADHVGGMTALQKRHQVPAWGPNDDRISGNFNKVNETDVIPLEPLDCQLKVLFIPGHTLSHIAFYNDHWLFCGDTLFSMGCGRMFEGHPAMFVESLNKIKALADDVAVYCGHEYTQDNCRFATAVEPDSNQLNDYCKHINKLRHEHKATLPTQLAIEKQLNPFLRIDNPELQKQVQKLRDTPVKDATSCFAALREWKDHF